MKNNITIFIKHIRTNRNMFKLVQITIHTNRTQFSNFFRIRRLSIAILHIISCSPFLKLHLLLDLHSALIFSCLYSHIPCYLEFHSGNAIVTLPGQFLLLAVSSSINSKLLLLLAYIGLFCYDPNGFAYFPIMNIWGTKLIERLVWKYTVFFSI